MWAGCSLGKDTDPLNLIKSVPEIAAWSEAVRQRGVLKLNLTPTPNPPISTSSQGADVPRIVEGFGKLSFAINIKYL